MIRTIGREQLLGKIRHDEKMSLVEISPLETYDRVHLPGAVHLSGAEVSRSVGGELPIKGVQIILYSLGGDEAMQVARQLEAMGYREIFYYREGKDDWLQAGLPVDQVA